MNLYNIQKLVVSGDAEGSADEGSAGILGSFAGNLLF